MGIRMPTDYPSLDSELKLGNALRQGLQSSKAGNLGHREHDSIVGAIGHAAALVGR